MLSSDFMKEQTMNYLLIIVVDIVADQLFVYYCCRYCGREPAASTAAGSKRSHLLQLASFLNEAVSLSE